MGPSFLITPFSLAVYGLDKGLAIKLITESKQGPSSILKQILLPLA